MSFYQPRMLVVNGEPQKDRWHMTIQSGSSNPTRHACCRHCSCNESGHATAEEAMACFNLYESKQMSVFDTERDNQFGKCLECNELTSSMVQAGSVFHKNLRLCAKHRSQETVSKHFMALCETR